MTFLKWVFFNKLKLFYNAINTSDAISWGGGICFGEYAGNGGLKFMVLSRLMGKKVYYINIGIGNIKSIKNKIETFAALLLIIAMTYPLLPFLTKPLLIPKWQKKI